MKATADNKQVGLWEYGFCTDREMITKLISCLNQLPERQYIHKLSIFRRPPNPEDLSKGGLLGFTSIKADHSEDPYKSPFSGHE